MKRRAQTEAMRQLEAAMRARRLEQRRQRAARRGEAAVLVQRVHRGRLERKRVEERRCARAAERDAAVFELAAARVQAVYRGRTCRGWLATRERLLGAASVRKIQRRYRGMLAEQEAQRAQLRQNEAFFDAMRARIRVESAKVLQRAARRMARRGRVRAGTVRRRRAARLAAAPRA